MQGHTLIRRSKLVITRKQRRGVIGIALAALLTGVVAISAFGNSSLTAPSSELPPESFALASLSCTLPVFVSVVVGSIATASFVSGFLTYSAYGLGMSVLLMALTLAVAFAKQGMVTRLRSMLQHVQRISAVFLIVAGVYITWFWADSLS